MPRRAPPNPYRATFCARAGAAMVAAILGCAMIGPAGAAPSAVVKTEQARAELVAHAPEGIQPGAPVWLGLKIDHQPHWHTYWKNPGDSGLPTTLAFQLPESFKVGEIDWPTPRALPVGPLMNYGYEGSLLLPVRLTVPAGWQGEALDIALRADWLICKDVCIPEGGDFALRLPSQSATALHAAAFAAAQAAAPRALPEARAAARVGADGLALSVEGLPSAWRGKALSFFPETAGVIDNAAKPKARWEDDKGASKWLAQVALSPQRSESPQQLQAVLVAAGEPVGVRVPVDVAGAWPALGAETPQNAMRENEPAPRAGGAAAPTSPSVQSLWVALALAFAGGALLNLMPCVFPVLSLKVLGFAHRGQQRSAHVASGLAYTSGVVVSFLLLGGVLMALRAGGEQLGWGFQLQSPPFVAALAVLFTLIGLNLAGVFDVGQLLPGSWAAARARHPLADSLLSGILAVAVASPCTAPFMGASLGLAATLPASQALTIFAVLGLGMAAPYLAACLWPGLSRWLPRPGAWMVTFKMAMAFPMWATVVWLLWVIGHQVGVDAATAVLGLLLALAFAAWALGSPTLGRTARRGFTMLALVCVALALVWAEPGLTAQGEDRPSATTSNATDNSQLSWEPWSPERVRRALEAQRPVFVDFTAAWCVTCQFNKRTVLSRAEVMADFQAKRVVLLRADWTRRDSAITTELARMGRNGVPVYALHVPGDAQPRLLNEILSAGEVHDALKGLP